jgi:hypothetical protein
MMNLKYAVQDVGLIITAQTVSEATHAGTLSRYVLVLNYRSDVANITPRGTLLSSGMFKVGVKILKYSLQFS